MFAGDGKTPAAFRTANIRRILKTIELLPWVTVKMRNFKHVAAKISNAACVYSDRFLGLRPSSECHHNRYTFSHCALRMRPPFCVYRLQ
jgi:hypothetical protein